MWSRHDYVRGPVERAWEVGAGSGEKLWNRNEGNVWFGKLLVEGGKAS